MAECIFCRIIAGAAPAELLYRDDQVIVFRDIHPISPSHVLIVPLKHIPSLDDASPDDQSLLGHMILLSRQVAQMEKIRYSGYRLVINTGADAGQTVQHLHLHVLGGRRLPFKFD